MQYFCLSAIYLDRNQNKRTMKRNNLWLATALMMAVTMTACSVNNDNEKEPKVVICPVDPGYIDPKDVDPKDNPLRLIELTRTEQQLVEGNNDFAFRLFRQSSDPLEDQIISPISITYALGMLNNGAAGETQAQINKTLGFSDTGADGINAFCQKMLIEGPNLDKLTKVMIANTIFMNKNYTLKPDFVKKANDYYLAQPETRDFADGKTLDVINQWASDHTQKMIEKVLSPDEFNPLAVSYLLNAIYFKGNWAQKFDANETQMEDFEHAGPDKYLLQVPMMHQKEQFPYTENNLCQAVSLPYGNGAFALTLLLPREGKQVSDVLNTLTAETWRSNYQYMGIANVDLKLPRFESNTNLNLVEIMKSLGMPYAFDPYKAEFPNFCDADTYIGLMKQVARIKLDETGTEAAAVTVIGMDVTAFEEPPVIKEVVLHANRPFLYVISEQSTGTIFFIGQYMGNQ